MKKLFLLLLLGLQVNSYGQQNPEEDSVISFTVQGNCAMCKKRIEETAKAPGVFAAVWNADTKLITIRYQPARISAGQLQKRIAAAGHDTEKEKAPDKVYSQLPDCCLYRDKTAENNEEASSSSQVMGVVLEEDGHGNLKPLKGASIFYNGNQGIVTGDNGFFRITPDKEQTEITISYTGFQPSVITVNTGDHLSIVLNTAKPLEGIRVVATRRPTYVSRMSTIRTQVMTEGELRKSACCNLGESFETNPSVDVSFSDAVTGSKQIQLLGLSGNYTQLTLESLPGPRGIATPLGLSYVPGTWVESIQLSKGVGSVANGFESIAGQINIELKKPATAEKLYANVYVNNMGKTDLNLNLAKQVNAKWSTALLLHNAFFENARMDFNKDGYRDQPTGNLFTALNRWKYTGSKGLEGQIGLRLLLDQKTGGETRFDPDQHKGTNQYYGLGFDTKRYEVFGKLGYLFPHKKYSSIGLQVSAFDHRQDAYFGLNMYNARQKNFYSNLIYQSVIGNSNHKFRTGLSFVADDYDETISGQQYQRKELVPGAFFEYTFSAGDPFSLILGMRADHNNLSGFFVTPRLHLRYEPVEGTTIRIAAGRGQRTATIFAENTGALVSARQVNILNPVPGKAYGLNPEVAWNEGITIDQKFRLLNRNGNASIDFFRTDFQQQVVADADISARELNFYNGNGISRSNSLQAELNYELMKKLELRLAWRMYDVKTTYHGVLLQRPLVSKHRGFLNLAYETGTWKFDYTLTLNGVKRIPFTGDNPPAEQLPAFSPAYTLMNAQVSKTIGKKMPVELYLGAENLTNYFQQQVILGADQPFGSYFDASLVWGPVSGRMFYAGLRFKIK